MNSSILVVTFSMLVALTLASQCSTSCNAVCDLSKANCDGAMVLGPVCNIAYSGCTAGCATVCGCQDACDGQCRPNYDTCNTDAGSSVILKLECSAQYDACIGQCEGACAVQTAVNTLGLVMGGAARK